LFRDVQLFAANNDDDDVNFYLFESTKISKRNCSTTSGGSQDRWFYKTYWA